MGRTKTALLYVSISLIALALYTVCLIACVGSDTAGGMCLGTFSPYVKNLQRLSKWMETREIYTKEFTWIAYILGGFTLVALARKRFRLGLFWVLASVAFAAEWAALLSKETLALTLHSTAVLSLALFWLGSAKFVEEKRSEEAPVSLVEMSAFFALFTCFMFMRWYALNRLPSGWDTEMCIFRFISSHWPSIWGHELGYSPQTSGGLLWLFLANFVGNFDEPFTFYLEQRYVAVAVSAAKLLLLYFFLRACVGRFAAFFGCILLGFGPPEDWWARQPGLHHLPGLIAIGVLWSTWSAIRNPTWRNFLLATFCSILCRFIYPSAMFMVFVPFSVFSALLVLRWREWRPHLGKIAFLLVGIGVWLGWASLVHGFYLGEWILKPPFAIPSNYALPQSFPEKLHRIFVDNLGDLFTGVLLHQMNPAHWTFSLTSLPGRSVTSAAIILSILGLGRMLSRPRDPITILFVVALLWASVPALTTNVADRRLGGIFIVLIAIAAREASFILELSRSTIGRHLTTVFACVIPVIIGVNLAWIGVARFFGMNNGVPRQVAVGRIFNEEVQSGTLVVDLVGQLHCDWFYTVYRKLKSFNCEAGIVSSQYQNGLTIKELIDNPRIDTQNWTIVNTGLVNCPGWKERRWSKVTYILTESPMVPKLLQELTERYPQGVTENRVAEISAHDKEKVVLFRVDMASGTNQ